MRFQSLTVRCYRIHRELTVEFARDLTLIGGPNESGKSTLIEALHRALFLKAKGNTEHHRAMVSEIHAGRPEVALRFEARGSHYELRKAFGPNGTTQLARTGAGTLTGDAAEAELAGLLGVEAGARGRELAGLWAHLWVWQGSSCEDPTTHATAQSAALHQRLQAFGGDALLTSPRDAKVAAHFAQAVATFFTQRGQPAKNGPLGQALAALTAAEQEQARAADKLQRLHTALREVEEAGGQLAGARQAEAQLETENTTLTAKLGELEGLRRREAEEQRLADSAAERLANAESAHAKILELAATLQSHAAAERPALEREAELRQAHTAAENAARTAEQASAAAVDALRSCRSVADLHAAQLERLRAAAELAELSRRDEGLRTRRLEAETLQAERARLPALDAARLRQLTRLHHGQLEAEATLRAVATGIEIVTTDAPVTIGGEPRGAGTTVVVTSDTELRVGERTVLRIRPGGGTSLTEARRAAESARHTLAAALQELAIPDLEAANALLARRNLISAQIDEVAKALAAPDVAALPRQLEAARLSLVAREAEVQRQRALLPAIVLVDDLPGATAAWQAAKLALRAAEEHEAATGAEVKAARKHLEARGAEWQQAREKLARLREELAGVRAQLQLWRETQGEDDARAARLVEHRSALERARAQLQVTRQVIAALQPELLERAQVRLGRAREELARRSADASQRRAEAQGVLRSDGSEDPVAAAAAAHAALERARARHAAIAEEARAVQLIHDEFEAAQRDLADRFIRPLAERISGYLACVFGPEARAALTHASGGFDELALVRGFSTVPFAALSGGAREQVAAAVRLALAEILAADFDGCLPVCFDDAFAYADPERVAVLHNMLDLAASRGLQVIVLSCNPADYRSLGAREVTLSRSLPQVRPSLPAATSDGIAETRTPEPVPSFPSEAIVSPPPPTSTNGHHAAPADVAELAAQLLAKLHEMEGTAGNQTLRAALGWDEATYEVVKRVLVAGNRIKPGRGRGGSVTMLGAD